jgi:hypothetical protein
VEERLDEEKIEKLQSWADGLLRDDRSELRAAAKAILMLIDEIEHLHVDLWHARDAAAADAPLSSEPEEEEEEPRPQPSLRSTLARRLRAVQHRHPEIDSE